MWYAPAVEVSSAPFWRTAVSAVRLAHGDAVSRSSRVTLPAYEVPANSGVLSDDEV